MQLCNSVRPGISPRSVFLAKIRRSLFAVPAVLLVLLSMQQSGCGPSLSEEELGTVIYRIPNVEGRDQNFELPASKVIGGEKEEPVKLVPMQVQ